jgi:hypothetical protein
MDRTQDDMYDKPPPPEGYEVPIEPNKPPQPNEQPEDQDLR